MRVSSSAPAKSRRTMMRGLAAGLAGASVPVAAIAGLTARSLTGEDPEILQPSVQLQAALDAYLWASRTEDEIVNEWYHQWPEPHEDIQGWAAGDMERDLCGWALKHESGSRIYVVKPEELREELRHTRAKRHRADLHHKIALAEAYEAEKARVKTASGYDEARAAHSGAADALKAVVVSIMERPSSDLAETKLKARSLVAFGHLEFIYQLMPIEARAWGPMVAAAFLRHLPATEAQEPLVAMLRA